MIKIEGDHILALISGFLKRYGEEKLALKVQQKIVNPQALQAVPLTKKKLEKIIKNYILQDDQLTTFYEQRQDSEQEEDEPQEHKKTENNKRPRKQSHSKEMKEESRKTNAQKEKTQNANIKPSIYSKFTKPQLLQSTYEKVSVQKQEDEHSSSQQEDRKKIKKEKKQVKTVSKIQKPIRKQTSESQEESSEPEKQQESSVSSEEKKQKPKKKIESIPVVRQVEAKVATENRTFQREVVSGEKKFFSRIDPSKISPLPQTLRDNTFEAKYRFGTGDQFGKYGNQKLKNQRGDGFKKMKGKLKNKDFQGGTIDPFKVNSISLL